MKRKVILITLLLFSITVFGLSYPTGLGAEKSLEQVLADANITLTKPDLPPRISAEEALQVADKELKIKEMQKTEPGLTIEPHYVLYTDPGSITPLMQKHPVWLINFKGMKSFHSHPVAAFFFLVDAETGQPLLLHVSYDDQETVPIEKPS